MSYLFACLEFVLFLTGVYSIRTSKLPFWITGNKYKAEGKSIRLLGFIMLIPSVTGFVSGNIVGYKSFEKNILSPSLFDLATTIQTASILIVIFICIIFIIENATPIKTKTTAKRSIQE